MAKVAVAAVSSVELNLRRVMMSPAESKTYITNDERLFSHVSAVAVEAKKVRVSASSLVNETFTTLPATESGVDGRAVSILSLHEVKSDAARTAKDKKIFFIKIWFLCYLRSGLKKWILVMGNSARFL